MNIVLHDSAPTTDGELALFRAMPIPARVVWCPLRHHQIDVVVCAQLQAEHRRRCSRANAGHCCQHLDSCAAEQLQQARSSTP